MGARLGKYFLGAVVAGCACLVLPLSAQREDAPRIATADLRTWLSVIASDASQGREVFTEGAGVASSYIADQLSALGVEPAGDDGTYFQTVRVLGVRNTGVSTVTVTVNGQSRTFRDGEGVRFPRNQGEKRVVTAMADFVGYGLDFAAFDQHDYAGHDVTGKVAIFLGQGPRSFTDKQNRLVGARAVEATDNRHAAAAIGPMPAQTPPAATPDTSRGPRPDFQTTQRLDAERPPRITASDDFFTFLFSGSARSYDDLKAAAERRDPLPAVDLSRVRITFDVQPSYEVVQTRLTRNVVARVRGADPQLRDTYLLYGAHYDHVGIKERPGQDFIPDISGMCPGETRVSPPADDIIFNGADDDGSGTVTLLALAKAYAQGAKPRRSILFVWHTGEEAGLYGSQYMADHPVVPLSDVAAQLNIDMIGRNKCDNPAEGNTLYLVGSDRISTELHQLNEQANTALAKPLTLDYTLNDPADVESLYTRSDHYSYAAKGIPIIFFTTGLHRDYHAVTDEIDRIDFDKMTRIADLIYQTGWRVANLDHLPVRDNRGPRAIARGGTR